VFYSAACTALWYGRWLLYFGDADGSSGQECSGNENSSKEVVHWVVGTAPLCARNFLLMAALGYCGRKFGCLTGTGGGVLETLLCGDSSGDGDADMAGWFAIVGDHAGDRAQSIWTEACDTRRMTQKQAAVLGGAKLLLWHWSQPRAFLWLLYVFRGEVTALGPTQQSLAAVVATREVLGSTLLAVARKGSSCELSTGCDNNPCKNGGNCVADDGEHQCQCASGWTGETCDHATSFDDNPCGAHGRCTVQTGAHFRFKYDAGFGGPECNHAEECCQP
jgi:hypothetical protein